MSQNHKGNTEPAISQEEHATISGIDGKKVFVIDNAGNQITSFSTPTVAILPYSYYQQSSLISGYVYYGFANPGANPTSAVFKILRETLNTGEVLFGSGTPQFVHTWSAASLASLTYL